MGPKRTSDASASTQGEANPSDDAGDVSTTLAAQLAELRALLFEASLAETRAVAEQALARATGDSSPWRLSAAQRASGASRRFLYKTLDPNRRGLRVLPYVDDFLGIARTEERAREALRFVDTLLGRLGIFRQVAVITIRVKIVVQTPNWPWWTMGFHTLYLE